MTDEKDQETIRRLSPPEASAAEKARELWERHERPRRPSTSGPLTQAWDLLYGPAFVVDEQTADGASAEPESFEFILRERGGTYIYEEDELFETLADAVRVRNGYPEPDSILIYRREIRRVPESDIRAAVDSTAARGEAAKHELERRTSRCGVLTPHDPHEWAAMLGEPEAASRTCEARWCDGGVPEPSAANFIPAEDCRCRCHAQGLADLYRRPLGKHACVHCRPDIYLATPDETTTAPSADGNWWRYDDGLGRWETRAALDVGDDEKPTVWADFNSVSSENVLSGFAELPFGTEVVVRDGEGNEQDATVLGTTGVHGTLIQVQLVGTFRAADVTGANE